MKIHKTTGWDRELGQIAHWGCTKGQARANKLFSVRTEIVLIPYGKSGVVQ